jgi:hypothetical protein
MFESRRAFAGLAALLFVPLALAAAQGETVSLGPMPWPNQTIKNTMTQDIDMEVTMTGAPPGGAAQRDPEGPQGRQGPEGPQGPMRSSGKIVFDSTQTVGGWDAEGHLTMHVTYDRVTADMTMNGKAVPSQNIFDSLKGKTLTSTFDAQGKVVDFQVPDDLAAMMPSLKELIASATGRLPMVTLAVGETTTVPLNMPLPIPMTGAAPMTLTGQTTIKLLSVHRDGDERIASLEQKSEGKLTSATELPGPNGPIAMKFNFTVVGSGTTEWNPDSGFVKSSTGTSTIDGTMGGPIGMTMHGTIRILTEGAVVR